MRHDNDLPEGAAIAVLFVGAVALLAVLLAAHLLAGWLW